MVKPLNISEPEKRSQIVKSWNLAAINFGVAASFWYAANRRA